MNLKRSVATIAAGLLTGAAALGFGLGTAEADPVDWTAGATTNVQLAVGDGGIDETIGGGAFTGQIDEDAGTITGEVVHPESTFVVGEGEDVIELQGQLTVTDIDLALDADADEGADNAYGSGSLEFSVVSALGLPLAPCTVKASLQLGGQYDGEAGTLDLATIEPFYADGIEGTCGGLLEIVQGLLGEASGDLAIAIGGDTEEPEETTTTTEAPAEETPATGGGAAPIAKSPAYTG